MIFPYGVYNSQLIRLLKCLVIWPLSMLITAKLLQQGYRYNTLWKAVDVMRQSACLVVNQVTVNTFAGLFNCMSVGRGSDSMVAPTQS